MTLPELYKIKGVAVGSLLEWELKNREISLSEFALAIGESLETIELIVNLDKEVDPALGGKLERYFGADPDYFTLLQESHKEKLKHKDSLRDLPKPNIRRILFWDTNFDKIDFQEKKRSVIERVFEKGDDNEIREIVSFYGEEVVANELKEIGESWYPSFSIRSKTFFDQNPDL